MPNYFILFRNRIRKISGFRHEAGYFIYPFKVDPVNWKLETCQQGYLHDYRREKLEGAAIQNFAFQDFALLSDHSNGVLLHSFQAGIMSVGEGPKYFANKMYYDDKEKPHLALYCYHNLWVTNNPQEQLSGDLFFDMAVTPFVGNLPEDSGSCYAVSARKLYEPIGLSTRVTNARPFLSIDSDKIGHYFIREAGELYLRLFNYSRREQTFTFFLNGRDRQTMTLQGAQIASVKV